MSQDHERIRRQVLVLEDLEGDERMQALQHLESCSSCSHLRERLLAAEDAAREFVRPPSSDDPLSGLTSLERAQARASLAGMTSAARRRGAVNLKRLVPLAAAAVLLAAILVPLQRERAPLEDLRVGSPLVLRGDGDPGAATDHGVSFRLRRAAYPVLLHVDAVGAVRLLHPAPGAEPQAHAAGQLLYLPPPGTGADWRADLPAGRETYLLGLAPADHPPVTADLATLAHGGIGVDHDQIARQTRQRLRAICGHAVLLNVPGQR